MTHGLAARPLQAVTLRATDGVRISAQESGNPSGPEILFIHGFSQCHLSWSRQYDSVLAESFRLITYDIRGHGASDKPAEAAFYGDCQRWATELKGVMKGFNLRKPVLVGWSYGGRIVAEYLMQYGDRAIAGVNFVGAFTKVDREILGPATPYILKMVSEKVGENIESTLAFLQCTTAQPLPAEELRMMLAYNMMVPAQIRGRLLGRPAPYEEALKKITVPVLISHGAEDRVILVRIVDYTNRVVSHAQSSIYDGVGHMPFWEAATRFNRELADFVMQCAKNNF